MRSPFNPAAVYTIGRPHPWVSAPSHQPREPPDHSMMDSSSSPEIARLESQIQALTDLSTRLQQLRNVPTWLYKSPNSMMPMEPIREQFENLRQLGNNLTSEPVQEALKAARESERDKSELTLKYRRDTNKAKYVFHPGRASDSLTPGFRPRTPSPDSPRYYESSLTKVSVPFPTLVGDSVPLTLAGLPDYIRTFNKTSPPSKLNIWVPTRAERGKLKDPVTVRLAIPDILIAYCVLSTPTSRSGLSVETVTVSGPREQVITVSFMISWILIASQSDKAALTIRIRSLPKGFPTDRQDGSDISTSIFPTADGEDRTRRSYFLPLIFLSLHAESLAIIRESFRRELFDMLTDTVVGGEHPTCRAGVDRERRRRGRMGFSTRYLSSSVGLFWEQGLPTVVVLCVRFNGIN